MSPQAAASPDACLCACTTEGALPWTDSLVARIIDVSKIVCITDAGRPCEFSTPQIPRTRRCPMTLSPPNTAQRVPWDCRFHCFRSRISRLVRFVPSRCSRAGEQVLYRGWMLAADRYPALANAIRSQGACPFTEPAPLANGCSDISRLIHASVSRLSNYRTSRYGRTPTENRG